MSMNNVPIIGKVLVVLSLFAILAIGSTIFSATRMQAIDDGYRSALDRESMAAVYIARSNRALFSMQSAIAALMISNTPAADTAAEADFQMARQEFSKFIQIAKSADPEDHYKMIEFGDMGLNLVDNVCGKSIVLGKQATSTETVLASQHEYLQNCAPSFKPVIAQSRQNLQKAMDAQKRIEDELSAVTRHTVMTAYGLVGGGLALVVLLAWFSLRRWISHPLKSLTRTMRSLADGDLGVEVSGSERRDEVGGMAAAMNVFKQNAVKLRESESSAERLRLSSETERGRSDAERATVAAQQARVVDAIAAGLDNLSGGRLTFRIAEAFPADYEKLRLDFNGAMEKLQDTMAVVSTNTAAIRSGTGEISSASDDLARRTEQQAASLEETAAALDEITATVRKTAEGSKHAREVVTEAKRGAEHSGQIVRQAVEAMSGIEKSSDQIGNIIGVIDEIAFQTNLLALNAGVEAARAGEAGRGFAVVASEVRALAQRSAEAAKEIKALISASSQQVEQGVDLVGQTGQALERIVAQVNEINGIVAEIAASAQEQASGLDQVNTAVNQMDQVTQQNAAMVEESTAASHALARETEELARLIGQFEIGAAGPRSVASRPAPRAAGKPTTGSKIVAAMKTIGSGGAARKPAPEANDWQEF